MFFKQIFLTFYAFNFFVSMSQVNNVLVNLKLEKQKKNHAFAIFGPKMVSWSLENTVFGLAVYQNIGINPLPVSVLLKMAQPQTHKFWSETFMGKSGPALG